MTGLRGYSEIATAVGVAWFSLTRGCLVVSVRGEDSQTDFYPTYALGEPAFEELRTKMFAAHARAKALIEEVVQGQARA